MLILQFGLVTSQGTFYWMTRQDRTGMHPCSNASSPEAAINTTRTWIERAVIGLNLCPFAKAVYMRNQIRYAVSEAQTTADLLGQLERELKILAKADPAAIDTTLLIHPRVLTEFSDYNEFLDTAEGAVQRLGLAGAIQIASFHPEYRFAGTAPDDVTNFTNRSPHPMLHLLREASIERAIAAVPEAKEIPRRNIETMLRLGVAGLAELRLAPAAESRTPPDLSG